MKLLFIISGSIAVKKCPIILKKLSDKKVHINCIITNSAKKMIDKKIIQKCIKGKIFDDYNDLEITPIFFPAFFYCRKCLTFTNPKVCPHDEESREQISGTKLRALIQEGKAPSEFSLRPEVAKIILSYDKPFVD